MTTVIVPLLKYFNKKFKGILNITGFAKERKLSFWKQEEFEGNIIALDVRTRKLFYMRRSNKKQACLIIDLNNLHSCTIKKQYNSINVGDLKHKKLDDFLKTIFLNLRFKNSNCEVPIPFFEAQKDRQENIEHLEAKAQQWKLLVSKMLPIQLGERA